MRVVSRFYEELWNAWDDAAVRDVLSPTFVFRGSLGTETQGRDGWRAYRDTVRAGSSDFHNAIDEVVIDGHRAAVRLVCSGTHTGPLLGVVATGRRFTYDVAAFIAADDDQLASVWALGDVDALRRQLS